MGMVKWLLIGGAAAAGYLLYTAQQKAERDCKMCKRLVTEGNDATRVHWPCPSCAVRLYDQPCRSCAEVAIAQAPMIATELVRLKAEYSRLPGDRAKREQVAAELVGLPTNIVMLAQRAGLARPQIHLT